MERPLTSSPCTFIIKFIVPILWISAIVAVNILAWVHDGWELGSCMLAISVISSPPILYLCVKLNRATVMASSLFLSNYIKEDDISYSEIDRVRRIPLGHVELLVIDLKRPYSVGTRVLVIPPIRLCGGFRKDNPMQVRILDLMRECEGRRQMVSH